MKLSDKAVIIGVDVGGTKIQAGIVNTDGKIIGEPVIFDTGGNDENEKIFGRITDSIEGVIKNSFIVSQALSFSRPANL